MGKTLLETLDARDQQANEKFRQQQIAVLQSSARKTYSDYDEVVDLCKEIAAGQPGMMQAIMQSDNPPEVAYAIGKSHPRYLEKIQKKYLKN